MAVFPKRITLKNSSDTDAAIRAAIGAGGTDEIIPGEVVVRTATGAVQFYTRDDSGNIVTLGSVSASSSQCIVAAAAPTVLPDGNPLADGNMWFDSTNSSFHVYYSSAWVQISGGSGATSLDGLTDVSYSAGSLEITGLDQIVYSSADVPTGMTYKSYANSEYGMAIGAYDTNVNGSFVYVHESKGVGLVSESGDQRVFVIGNIENVNNTPELRISNGNPMDDTPTGFSVGFTIDGALAQDTTYTLPSTDGTSGQFLSTDGAGILSWASGGSGGGLAFWGGGDFDTGTPDGDPADGGNFD